MAQPPAFCPNCGAIFPAPIGVGGKVESFSCRDAHGDFRSLFALCTKLLESDSILRPCTVKNDCYMGTVGLCTHIVCTPN